MERVNVVGAPADLVAAILAQEPGVSEREAWMRVPVFTTGLNVALGFNPGREVESTSEVLRARDLFLKHPAPYWLDTVRVAIQHRLVMGDEKSTCSKGCHWCCRWAPAVTAPEAKELVRRVRGKAFQARWDAFLTMTDEERVTSLDDAAFCPFLDLESRACSIYEFRPVVCRIHFSQSDPDLCRQDLRTVPYPILWDLHEFISGYFSACVVEWKDNGFGELRDMLTYWRKWK